MAKSGHFRDAVSGRYVMPKGHSYSGTTVIEGSRGERVVKVDKTAAADALRQAAGKIGRSSISGRFKPAK